MNVKTARVSGRRQLRFDSLDEIVRDADRCVAENYRTLGNWTAGQIFEHLARTMNGSIDGLPFRVPTPVRLILKLFKRRFLNGPMSPGFNLPKNARSLEAETNTTTTDGLEHLRRAVERLKQTEHRAASPAFGVLTREESDRLQMTHAAMHLSFLVPRA